MTERAYLDWNSTAPLALPAREAMLAALDVLGNPSSIHAEGRAARHLVEQARSKVAAVIGADARSVIFTSGGTEANGLALTPAIETGRERAPRDRLLISGIEHPSVRSGHHFSSGDVEELPVTSDGVLDLATLEERLATLRLGGVRRPLVSIMHANNETGVVQPITQAAVIVHQAGGLLHVDAVQSVGRIDCNINSLCADLLTLSGHKLGAPKGIGALVKRSEDLHIKYPMIRGGGQEHGARAGTENVLGIIGFGAAADFSKVRIGEAERIADLRDDLERGVLEISPDARIFGIGVNRLWNTSLFSVPGIKAETALIALDLEGIAVSSGAACSSGKVAASHVLAAMGVPAGLAAGAIRVSLGATTSAHEIELFLKAWRKLVMGLSKARRGIAA